MSVRDVGDEVSVGVLNATRSVELRIGNGVYIAVSNEQAKRLLNELVRIEEYLYVKTSEVI